MLYYSYYFRFSFSFTPIKVLCFSSKTTPLPQSKQMTSVLRKIELPIPTATYDLIKRFSDRNPNIEGKLGRATTQGANGNFIVDGTELLECLLCSRYNDEERKNTMLYWMKFAI
eukprot:NODE_548_length_6849_cov_0.379852.p4 type:complete len:114 gc:universal NODE_548_length_6849_cov_0.379852:6012-6353(+)